MGLWGRRPDVVAKPEPIEVGVGRTDLYLADYGLKKVPPIRVIREFLGLGLRDAKSLVDAAPLILAPKLGALDAQRFKAALEDAGATVELKSSGPSEGGLHVVR